MSTRLGAVAKRVDALCRQRNAAPAMAEALRKLCDAFCFDDLSLFTQEQIQALHEARATYEAATEEPLRVKP